LTLNISDHTELLHLLQLEQQPQDHSMPTHRKPVAFEQHEKEASHICKLASAPLPACVPSAHDHTASPTKLHMVCPTDLPSRSYHPSQPCLECHQTCPPLSVVCQHHSLRNTTQPDIRPSKFDFTKEELETNYLQVDCIDGTNHRGLVALLLLHRFLYRASFASLRRSSR
jgi:hypothetical protein